MRFVTLLLIIILTIIFFLKPELDIHFSNLFYNSKDGFYLANNYLVLLVNSFVKLFFIAFVSGIGFFSLKKFVITKSINPKYYRKIIYVALVIVLGAGIFVHLVIKDNMGRPRPFQTVEFGGLYAFQPPFKASNLCKKDCSFVSGHAAIGFMIYALAFLYQGRERYFYLFIGTVVGLSFGLVRIILGKHFLSDVIFSGILLFITSYLLALLMKPWNA